MIKIKKPIAKLRAGETRLGMEVKKKAAVKSDALNSVTVCFSNPKYNYRTSVGSKVTRADAVKYFVGETFNVGSYPKEIMRKCTKIIYHKAK